MVVPSHRAGGEQEGRCGHACLCTIIVTTFHHIFNKAECTVDGLGRRSLLSEMSSYGPVFFLHVDNHNQMVLSGFICQTHRCERYIICSYHIVQNSGGKKL